MPCDRLPLPGVYLHIPFCLSKCSYCSFTSYPCPGEPPAGYLEALRRQLALLAGHPLVRELTFGSLYLGGGTPTIYDAEALAALLAEVRRQLAFSGPVEVTVEANPNTVTPAKLCRLRRAGANRLSIGVQSFADPVLAAIGRTHTAAEARAAIRSARQAGFANLSLDLIYGLPGQTLENWRSTLDEALSAGPEHLSLYELMIEEGTLLASRLEKGEIRLPEEETVLAMEEEAHLQLAACGCRRYEISNFARPGRECRHNLNYWQNGPYLGLGAGAVSCLAGLRLRNVDDPARFAEIVAAGQPAFAEAEALSLAASFRETVIMGLRLLAGISVAGLARRYGFSPVDYYGPTLARLLAEDLLALEGDRLRLTARGLPVANQVLAELV